MDLDGKLAFVPKEDGSPIMDLTAPHRIVRRLAGRIRAAATGIEDRKIATKLLLMAIELEQLAEAERTRTARRN